MISHKYKCIFIHIPKCAGSSIRDFYFDYPNLDWKVANYDLLYGWCPVRKIHLQHATPEQLVETSLIDKDIWHSYFKFSFIRNPWDRAYSDYLWIQKDRNIKGSFKDYIFAQGSFKKIFRDNSNKEFRGDHLTNQVEYVSNQHYPLDFIGTFESFQKDIQEINNILGIKKTFNIHTNNSKKRYYHYSNFYTNTKKRYVETVFKEDIERLDYSFEDLRKGRFLVKKFL